MKLTFKPLILYCFIIAILFSSVSCEWGANRNGILTKEEIDATSDSIGEQGDTFTSTDPESVIPEETESSERIPETTTELITPQETISGEQTPDSTTTENAIPEESTNPEENVSSEEITKPQETTPPSGEEITKPQETTPPSSEEITKPQETTSPSVEQTTTPQETTAPDLPHEHTIINGQCVCGYVFVLENESLFDDDKDGNKDIFYFSSVLPEHFTSKNAVRVGADEYDLGLSSWVGVSREGSDTYYFCRNDRKSYIVYEVEVAKAGVYEMAICQRMKDAEVHGAKFTVNAERDEKYTFTISYQFTDEQDMVNVCENATTMNSYMFGIELELVSGVNYIKIELAPGIESGQYFRDFYLVKTSK